MSHFDSSESHPPQWHDFSPENIRIAHQEREASIRLRDMISSTLSQTSADMREQADRVEEALSRRLSETEEATARLENELKAVRKFLVLTWNIITLITFLDGRGDHSSRDNYCQLERCYLGKAGSFESSRNSIRQSTSKA